MKENQSNLMINKLKIQKEIQIDLLVYIQPLDLNVFTKLWIETSIMLLQLKFYDVTAELLFLTWYGKELNKIENISCN